MDPNDESGTVSSLAPERIRLLLCEYLGPILSPSFRQAFRDRAHSRIFPSESNENEMIGDRNHDAQAEGGRVN